MIIDRAIAARTGGREILANALRDARTRTLSLLDAYVDALGPTLPVPYSEQINPPMWEAGHVGWFQDYWIARNRERALGIHCDPDHERPVGRLPQADALYNSSRVAHTTRWQLPLPDLAATRAYLDEGLAETLALLATTAETDDELYFFRLVLFHEDMHTEAAIYMAQALGIPLPAALLAPPKATPRSTALTIPAQTWMLGYAGDGFAFDNELPAHRVEVASFEIDATVVTWDRYLPFIEATGAQPPRYLRKCGDTWQRCLLGEWHTLPLDYPDQPPDLVRGRRLVSLGRATPADRSRVGSRRGDTSRFSVGRSVGMDREPLFAVHGIRRPSLSRLLGTLVRRSVRAARRESGNLAAHGASTLPQFLHAGTQRHS